MNITSSIGALILAIILGFVTYFTLLPHWGEAWALVSAIAVGVIIATGWASSWSLFPRRG